MKSGCSENVWKNKRFGCIESESRNYYIAFGKHPLTYLRLIYCSLSEILVLFTPLSAYLATPRFPFLYVLLPILTAIWEKQQNSIHWNMRHCYVAHPIFCCCLNNYRRSIGLWVSSSIVLELIPNHLFVMIIHMDKQIKTHKHTQTHTVF